VVVVGLCGGGRGECRVCAGMRVGRHAALRPHVCRRDLPLADMGRRSVLQSVKQRLAQQEVV
jgi:hypothetical protein